MHTAKSQRIEHGVAYVHEQFVGCLKATFDGSGDVVYIYSSVVLFDSRYELSLNGNDVTWPIDGAAITDGVAFHLS